VIESLDSGRGQPLVMDIPAKINFWLEVLSKREDGYHNLSSLMLPIGIYDRVEAARTQHGIELVGNSSEVPLDQNNLAWRAAALFLRQQQESGGVRLRLDKRIPIAAGLGGGSADAAAVLLLLNRLTPTPLPHTGLTRLARQLGADVPFFLGKRPSIATGIGEILEEIQGIPSYPLVLVKAPVAVSTAEVYSRLKLTRGYGRIRIASLLAHPWEPQGLMVNDLESVTLEMYPELAEIKEWLRRSGALGVLMSGSGPTLFGVFRTRRQAEAVGSEAKTDWPDCWVGITEVLANPSEGTGREQW
jgi:4-diphosphocytidyl-2-C-methyl-D-erythritol kinase